MKRFAFLLAALCVAIPACAQGVMHGPGDPRTLTPTPNCANIRFFVDDSTGIMYQANQGSPCVWVLSGGAVTVNPLVASNLIAGYTAYLPFTEGTGTVANDITGNGNNCTFASAGNAPTWTTRIPVSVGMQVGTIGTNGGALLNRYCIFPASATLTDTNIINARTITFCGWIEPIGIGHSNLNGTQWETVFGGKAAARMEWLGLSSPQIVGQPYTQWLIGYPTANFGSGFTVSSGTNNSLTGWGCVTWALGAASDSTNDHLYINGVEVKNYVVQSRGFYDSRAAGDNYTLGGGTINGNFFFDGIITSVLAYPTQLTAAQIAQNYQLLAQAAIAARGVSNNYLPNQSALNQLDLSGDSFISGTPGGVTSLSGTLTTNATFTITLSAASGTDQASLTAGFPVVDAPLYSSPATFNIAFSEGGTNDLSNGMNAAATAASRIAFNNALLNQGWTVATTTMLSKTAGLDAAQETVSETLRQWSETKRPNAYLIDWANEPCLGAAGANTDPGALGCFTSATGAKATITNCSLTSNVATFAAVNTYVSGDVVWLSGLTGNCAPLNNTSTTTTVIATGLSGTQFEANITNANIGSTATAGVAYTLFQADGLHPTQVGMNELARMTANVINYITGSTQSNPSTTTSTSYSLAATDRYLQVNPATTMTLTLPACYGWSPSEPFTITNVSASTVNLTPGSLNGVNFTLNGSTSALAMSTKNATVYAQRLSASTSGCGWFTR